MKNIFKNIGAFGIFGASLGAFFTWLGTLSASGMVVFLATLGGGGMALGITMLPGIGFIAGIIIGSFLDNKQKEEIQLNLNKHMSFVYQQMQKLYIQVSLKWKEFMDAIIKDSKTYNDKSEDIENLGSTLDINQDTDLNINQDYLLFEAITSDNFEKVLSILNKDKTKSNIVNEDGNTPLIYSLFLKRNRIATLILELFCPNVNIINNDGVTALYYIKTNINNEPENIQYQKILELIREKL